MLPLSSFADRNPRKFAATGSRHAVEFRDRVEFVDPRLLRANKYLPAWHQFISLAKRSKPHVVGFWLIVSRCGIDRRPAVRAESLHTDVSTIGGLSIFRRFAGQKHERSRIRDNDRSQWSAAHRDVRGGSRSRKDDHLQLHRPPPRLASNIRRSQAIAGCCARAASGHAAAPPRSVMSWRRRASSMGSTSEPDRSAYRRLRMPRKRSHTRRF